MKALWGLPPQDVTYPDADNAGARILMEVVQKKKCMSFDRSISLQGAVCTLEESGVYTTHGQLFEPVEFYQT